MPVTWYDARVVDIQDETHQTKRFYLEIPNVAQFDFQPGQFVTFDLPIHEKKNKRYRSYSIASNPDNNILEFVIVLLEGGLGTTYLFNEINVGSTIPFMGPLGKFTLREKLDKEICFICTGTGIAPFRSMTKHIHKHAISHKDIRLIFGTRTKDDVLYFNEMNSLAKEMDGFEYDVCLSRETKDSWDGHLGYVHAVYEKEFADKRPVDFYLCGWENMINEAKKRLYAMGYDKDSVHYESYG